MITVETTVTDTELNVALGGAPGNVTTGARVWVQYPSHYDPAAITAEDIVNDAAITVLDPASVTAEALAEELNTWAEVYDAADENEKLGMSWWGTVTSSPAYDAEATEELGDTYPGACTVDGRCVEHDGDAWGACDRPDSAPPFYG